MTSSPPSRKITDLITRHASRFLTGFEIAGGAVPPHALLRKQDGFVAVDEDAVFEVQP